MKRLSILVPASVAGVLLSAMVLAAPQSVQVDQGGYVSLDRAAAYHMAMAN